MRPPRIANFWLVFFALAPAHAEPPSRDAVARVTLEQIKAGTVNLERALPQLDPLDPDLERTFPALLASNPGWSGEAVRLLTAWLGDGLWTDQRERDLALVLQGFRDQPGVKRFVAQALTRETSPMVRRLLLHGMARATTPPPLAWHAGLERSLRDRDPAVQRDAVALVRRHELATMDPQLEAIGSATDLPADLRVAAVEALAGRAPQSAAEFSLLVQQLKTATDPLTRLVAARGLGASRPNRSRLLTLAPLLADQPTLTGALLLPAFSRNADRGIGLAFVTALAGSPTAELITEGDLDRLLAFQGPAVERTATPLRVRLRSRQKERGSYLAELTRELPPGDAQKGKALFLSAKTNCAMCHRVAGQGGGIGPNLSRISFLRGRRELLESVVLPAAYIAPEFRTLVVTTSRGQVAAGIPVFETSAALYLRNAEPALVRIPRGEMDEANWSPASLMPDGFEKLLTRQELGDLLEFLGSLR